MLVLEAFFPLKSSLPYKESFCRLRISNGYSLHYWPLNTFVHLLPTKSLKTNVLHQYIFGFISVDFHFKKLQKNLLLTYYKN